MLSALFLEAVLASYVLGFGMNAIFSVKNNLRIETD